MSYVKLSVLSNTLKTENAKGRSSFATLAYVVSLQKAYEEITAEAIAKDSLEQAVGKTATKEVTGILGAPLSRVMSIAVLLEEYLSDEKIFELHAVEQIGVQFKNITQRGEWHNDKLIKRATEVSSIYGIQDCVSTALQLVRGKADVSAVLEEPIVHKKTSELILETKESKSSNDKGFTSDDIEFDFSDL